MAKKAFSFDGTTSTEAPYIEKEAFETLAKGTIIRGIVDYVEQYKGMIKAAVLINGHTTRVTLWDTTLEEARKLIGQSISVKYNGFNDEGWPILYVRHTATWSGNVQGDKG